MEVRTVSLTRGIAPLSLQNRLQRLRAWFAHAWVDVAAVSLAILVGFLFLHPALQEWQKHGVGWPVYIAHGEGMSLTTYGKWWILPPHRFMTDGFTGEFPTFYNALGNVFVNLLAAMTPWSAMVVQAIFIPPLLGFLFVFLNYLSLKAVLQRPKAALLASAVIALGTNSRLGWFFNWPHAAGLSGILHVPAYTMCLSDAQCFGWLFFLPTLCALYLAHQKFTYRRAILFGTLFGLLFHAHTLTFINAGVVIAFYLTTSNLVAAKTAEGFRLRSWLAALVLTGGVFSFLAYIGHPSFTELVALWIVVILANFLGERDRRFYYVSFGTAAVVAVPYLLAMAQKGTSSILSLVERYSFTAISADDLFLFFSVYWLGGALVLVPRIRKSVDSRALVWAFAVLLGTLFLANNHLFGWGNHPYRFAINLIFPLAILFGLGITGGKFILSGELFRWSAILLALHAWNFYSNGARIYGRIESANPATAQFLETVHKETGAALNGRKPYQVKMITPPEFNYPSGLVQSAVLLNYSQTAGFIPDYRYQLWPERYENRMRTFCFLFPRYPHFDAHTEKRLCKVPVSPPSSVFGIKDPVIKNSILPVYSIEFAASNGQPFSATLVEAVANYRWKLLAKTGKREEKFLAQMPQLDLPGVAKLGAGTYSATGFEVELQAPESGLYYVALGGADLFHRAEVVRVDSQELVQIGNRNDSWLLFKGKLTAGKHRLIIPWKNENFASHADYFHFIAAIRDKEMGRYLELPRRYQDRIPNSRSPASAGSTEIATDPSGVFATRVGSLKSPVLRGEAQRDRSHPSSPFSRATAPAYTVLSRVQGSSTAPEGEQHIAVDPANPTWLVMAISDFSQRGGYNTTKYTVSFGNGALGTLIEHFVPMLNGYPVTGDDLIWESNSDPVVAIDRNHNAYMANLYFNSSNQGNGLYVSSGNLSVGTPFTFTKQNTIAVVTHPQPHTTLFEDKPWIAVDNSEAATQGNVYVSWTRFTTDANMILFSRSTDLGQHWSAPIQVSLSIQDGAVQGSQVAVGPAGEVYVAYEVFYIRGFRRQFIAKSVDGGLTFGTPIAATPYFNEVTFSSYFRKNSFPALAVSPVGPGNVYLLYSDQPNSTVGAQVEFISSTDGGATFSTAKVINDVSRGQQFFPAITVDEVGTIHTTWFDTRNNPYATAIFYDVYASRSNDEGATFSTNTRVTRSSIYCDNVSFIGDYTGIGAGGGYAHAVWNTGGFYYGVLFIGNLQ